MTILDADRCYRALEARDARFDGQFIAGVHTTGIYCRPSCPATTPRARNVRFYPTAAAAHEAGLRACKRCQPDATPGNPQWNLRDDLVARAMRLILDGVIEREGVGGLASRLGYSTRHLTRVISAELGAGPLALARAHRAETARTLLAGTELPTAQIAFASGFRSIRQFNDTVREVYDLSPSGLRALTRRGAAAAAPHAEREAAGGTITLRLAARAPFDGAGILQYLRTHAIDGVEHVTDDGVERWIRLPGGDALVRLWLDDERPGVRCTATLAALSDVGPLTARIRRWFDLDADASGIDDALGQDALLGPLVAATPGMRIPGGLDAAETLVRTMVGQQISLSAARTVLGRITREIAELDGAPHLEGAVHPFPSPAALAEHGAQVLRGPGSRVRAILAVSEQLANGELVLDIGMPADELRARLLALPGVGPWTADYVALRVLGAPDILLSTDLVLLGALQRRGLASTAREATTLGERWAPWRSYATLHLWRDAALSSRAAP